MVATLEIISMVHPLRERKEMPQVLFVFSSRKGGEGVEARENTKPEKKREECEGEGGGNVDNLRKM